MPDSAPPASDVAGLAALEAALARDLARLNHPPAPWVPERTGPDGCAALDVLLVGGGMNGLAAAFALRRLGIARIRQVDRRPAGQEGPWLTYARMERLRSPKHLAGPVQGIAALTFRAWYEAQHGAEGWEALGHIPRPVWAAYLQWFAQASGAAVENGVAVEHVRPAAEFVAVTLRHAGGAEEVVQCRQLVLATGREGQARPRVPAPFRPWLGERVRHSSDPIDFAAFHGRRVAVIGLAASAYDNAAEAAEAGAEVTLIGRAAAVPRLNKMRQTVYPGFAHGFAALDDAERLRWLGHVTESRIAPPRHTVQRVAAAGVRLIIGAEITAVAPAGAALRLETTAGAVEADLVILGTGFAIDLAAAPELAGLAHAILTYRDLLGDGEGAMGELLDCPALDPGFGFRARPGAAMAGLGRIRCYTHASQPSLGNLASDIPHAGEGAERLARAIAEALFVEDRAHHWQRLLDYAEPELLGDEWPEGGA
ncbi:MAG: NAD(P)/FAD-dependent oxidoreductase [Pseudomonadota bacterium]